MNQEKCPYCGCKEMVEGKQSGYAALAPADRIMTFRSQVIYHQICLNCGAVVKSYVMNPKRLL